MRTLALRTGIVRLTVFLLAMLLFSGCNLFDFFHTPEESSDPSTLQTEAEARYRNGDYNGAAAVASRALQIQPGNSRLRLLRMRALLLAVSGGRSAPVFFPELFTSDTNLPPLGGITGEQLQTLLANMQTAAADSRVITNTNISDTTVSPLQPGFLLERTLTLTLLGQLVLLDGNTNGIPGEPADPFNLVHASQITAGSNAAAQHVTVLSNARRLFNEAADSYLKYTAVISNTASGEMRTALSNHTAALHRQCTNLILQLGGTP